MIIIAAMSHRRLIGNDSELPWELPDEYRHFLSQITGQAIVMGRKSYEIFGPDLTAAEVLVLSRSLGRLDQATVVRSLAEAVEHARLRGRQLFCGGGAQVYRQALPLAKELRLSLITGEYRGDSYFPEVDWERWQLVSSTAHPEWEYRIYRRARPDDSGPAA